MVLLSSPLTPTCPHPTPSPLPLLSSPLLLRSSPPPLLSAPLLSEGGTRDARGKPTMGEPRRPRGPTGRTREPTKEVQGVHRETSEGAQKALRVGQKRRGTLPCLSQTGEGFLFVFDFHKKLTQQVRPRSIHRTGLWINNEMLKNRTATRKTNFERSVSAK